MAAGDNPHIARAATLVRHYNADEQLRHELQAHERFLHDQASRELTARLDGFDDGHAEGHAKGRPDLGRVKKASRDYWRYDARKLPRRSTASCMTRASGKVTRRRWSGLGQLKPRPGTSRICSEVSRS